MAIKSEIMGRDLDSLDPFMVETNPIVKFVIVILIAVYYFVVTDLYKLYIILAFVLLYYNLRSFSYQVSKPYKYSHSNRENFSST